MTKSIGPGKLYINGQFVGNCTSIEIVTTPTQRTEVNELGSKLAAQILLTDHLRRIVIPNDEEWFGIGLLERDDELKRRKG